MPQTGGIYFSKIHSTSKICLIRFPKLMIQFGQSYNMTLTMFIKKILLKNGNITLLISHNSNLRSFIGTSTFLHPYERTFNCFNGHGYIMQTDWCSSYVNFLSPGVLYTILHTCIQFYICHQMESLLATSNLYLQDFFSIYPHFSDFFETFNVISTLRKITETA